MEVGWVGRNEKIPVRKKKMSFFFSFGTERVIGRSEIPGSNMCIRNTKGFNNFFFFSILNLNYETLEQAVKKTTL